MDSYGLIYQLLYIYCYYLECMVLILLLFVLMKWLPWERVRMALLLFLALPFLAAVLFCVVWCVSCNLMAATRCPPLEQLNSHGSCEPLLRCNGSSSSKLAYYLPQLITLRRWDSPSVSYSWQASWSHQLACHYWSEALLRRLPNGRHIHSNFARVKLRCIDTASNRQHCGALQHACNSTQQCQQGVCVDVTQCSNCLPRS